ncbi:MAG: hypothetical protein ACKVIE_05590 [Candidatus Poseidoniales archaeon]
MRIIRERNQGTSWEIAGINARLRVRAMNTMIEINGTARLKLSRARMLESMDRIQLQLRILFKLSCRRIIPPTIAPPKKKKGV